MLGENLTLSHFPLIDGVCLGPEGLESIEAIQIGGILTEGIILKLITSSESDNT